MTEEPFSVDISFPDTKTFSQKVQMETGRTQLERELLALGVLAGYSASAVREILAEIYGEENVPAVRTIQVRTEKVRYHCLEQLKTCKDGESQEDKHNA